MVALPGVVPQCGDVLAFLGWSPSGRARVAEWQTRWLQVPVPIRGWRFNSSRAHVVKHCLLLVRAMLSAHGPSDRSARHRRGHGSVPPASRRLMDDKATPRPVAFHASATGPTAGGRWAVWLAGTRGCRRVLSHNVNTGIARVSKRRRLRGNNQEYEPDGNGVCPHCPRRPHTTR